MRAVSAPYEHGKFTLLNPLIGRNMKMDACATSLPHFIGKSVAAQAR